MMSNILYVARYNSVSVVKETFRFNLFHFTVFRDYRCSCLATQMMKHHKCYTKTNKLLVTNIQPESISLKLLWKSLKRQKLVSVQNQMFLNLKNT